MSLEILGPFWLTHDIPHEDADGAPLYVERTVSCRWDVCVVMPDETRRRTLVVAYLGGVDVTQGVFLRSADDVRELGELLEQAWAAQRLIASGAGVPA